MKTMPKKCCGTEKRVNKQNAKFFAVKIAHRQSERAVHQLANCTHATVGGKQFLMCDYATCRKRSLRCTIACPISACRKNDETAKVISDTMHFISVDRARLVGSMSWKYFAADSCAKKRSRKVGEAKGENFQEFLLPMTSSRASLSASPIKRKPGFVIRQFEVRLCLFSSAFDTISEHHFFRRPSRNKNSFSPNAILCVIVTGRFHFAIRN